MVIQPGMGILRRKAEVLRSAFRIESLGHRQRLDQGGFAGSVLPDKESDLLVEINPVLRQVLYNGKPVQIAVLRRQIDQGHAADIQIFHAGLRPFPGTERLVPAPPGFPGIPYSITTDAAFSPHLPKTARSDTPDPDWIHFGY